MNAFQRLKKSNPKTWAWVTLPVFIFATLVVLPVSIIWDCVDNFFRLMYRSVREFFHDLYYDCKYDNKDVIPYMKLVWKDWFSIVRTGKGINNGQDKD